VNAVRFMYGMGVGFGALVGFFSPFFYLGFIPLSVGLIWAAYDLVEVDGDEPPSAPKRTNV
jgi:hypothetical protein